MKSTIRVAPALTGVLCAVILSGCSGSDSAPGNPLLKGDGGKGGSEDKTWVSRRLDESDQGHQQLIVVRQNNTYSARMVEARYGSSSPHVSYTSTEFEDGFKITKAEDGNLLLIIEASESDTTGESKVELQPVDGRTWSPAKSGVFSRWAVSYEGQRDNADSYVQITTGRSHWNEFIWISLVASRDIRNIAWMGDENSWPNSGFRESSSDHIAKTSNCDTKETIAVPAGTFNTCRRDEGNGLTIWYGNVRSGVVRLKFDHPPENPDENPWRNVPGMDSGIRLNKSQVWELQEFSH